MAGKRVVTPLHQNFLNYCYNQEQDFMLKGSHHHRKPKGIHSHYQDLTRFTKTTCCLQVKLHTLDRMRLAFGKVPDISLLQVVYLVLPGFVNSREPDRSGVKITPFRLRWSQL